MIRDWVETTRHKSPNWEATEHQVKDWRAGLTGHLTLENFSYFFVGPPHLDYNKQAIHILSTSLLQALEAEQYPTHLLEKIPTICELSRKISHYMRYLSKKHVFIKVPRTLEEDTSPRKENFKVLCSESINS